MTAMDALTIAVVVIAVAALFAAIRVVARSGTRTRPDDATFPDGDPEFGRPTDPGAEAMGVEGPGEPGPPR